MPLENKIVTKLWGFEEWLANNEQYCGKLLRIRPGYACSIHYHPLKRETFSVIKGAVILELWASNDITTFPPNEYALHEDLPHSVEILPGWAHRFSNPFEEWATIVETSTPHDDLDVVRIEDSKKL
jgi:mannose-6-phosphate isomerase-like protein (cupin superfamily)